MEEDTDKKDSLKVDKKDTDQGHHDRENSMVDMIMSSSGNSGEPQQVRLMQNHSLL